MVRLRILVRKSEDSEIQHTQGDGLVGMDQWSGQLGRQINTAGFFLWVEYKRMVYKTGKPQSRNQWIKKFQEASEVLS